MKQQTAIPYAENLTDFAHQVRMLSNLAEFAASGAPRGSLTEALVSSLMFVSDRADEIHDDFMDRDDMARVGNEVWSVVNRVAEARGCSYEEAAASAMVVLEAWAAESAEAARPVRITNEKGRVTR